MEDDDLIPLSALQHYLYCPRQCALIHVERLWAENRQTAEGRLLHQRADQPLVEQRHGVRSVTAMPLLNLELGITGVADMVEFRVTDEGERAYPVEYKRGRPKAHRADEVQLCAQALCLEAMLGKPLAEGALFYGKTRRRKVVPFDDELRRLTLQVIQATRELLAAGSTPLAEYQAKRCDSCSLIDLCQPRLLERSASVESWLRLQFKEE
ncbi:MULTISPECIES: CRISPR-associated protein Cas4 [unclassified Pseudomonas]|uniref:CRISPR-associated protein Cas4 n=1 Tax=unclassified Pseudomonas TaxID=196821 RepID=UPI002448B845|nr:MULTISPECIES: CRISPR-associated protein Cas4 [unclassified Pseudomonas]MDG9927787.1 CRISPR-associated protein Cas4 [Pseudomonas sp. GD04042]MDH0483114.1 CRISPR-associated protein Cas4 [Pseudomonas sp. GD04015]MDH0605307.1 CRISPR-associated protein Cas4 [Pseudomonas sp. GD03869]